MEDDYKIYYTKFEQPLIEKEWNSLISRLPDAMQIRCKKFIRWQDQHSYLFGKLLLIKGLNDFGYNESLLNNIKYTHFEKPYLDIGLIFNISHSGSYIMCGFSKKCQIGVDVERIRPMQFKHFTDQFTQKEWEKINSHADPYHGFFHFWTAKEALIKADGRGLSIPLQDIELTDKEIFIADKKWHTKALNVDSHYASHIASNFEINKVEMQFISWYE